MTIEKVRPRCFLDVDVDGQNVGRIVIELFADICPLTCENFRALCTGEKGTGKTTNKPLHYKGVPFHRIVKNFIIQSGDFVAGNGTGGESIYGGTFKDENFEIKHDKPFLLSMANKGKDTNGSQFFITTQPAPHLDGKHTVFGHVISGQQVVLEIENQKTGANSRPVKDVVIANCGELVLKAKPKSRKTRSASESSPSTDSESEKSKSRKKKKKKQHERRNKRDKREKISSRIESASKHEISFDCSVDPKEIPEVPANNFLMRRSPAKDGNRTFNRTPGRGGYVFSRKPAVSRSGRKIKGRGLMRYRTPSSSGSRSGSETPPHWRQAQARVVPLDQVISRIGGQEGSRSASPEEETEKDNRQKPDAVPLKQRLGPIRKTVEDDEREEGEEEEEEEEPLNIKIVPSDVRRGRETRPKRESPKWRKDRLSDRRRRRHSISDEESDTSPEIKSRSSLLQSMVVKADVDRRRNEDRDRRNRRSPIKKGRERTPDRRPYRSDDRQDRSARNQNLERNARRDRPSRDATSTNNSVAKPRHESEKDGRRHNKESDSKRPAKREEVDRSGSRRSPISRRRHSSTSNSDSERRKRRRKDSQVSSKEMKILKSHRHGDQSVPVSARRTDSSVTKIQEAEVREPEIKEGKPNYLKESEIDTGETAPSEEKSNQNNEKTVSSLQTSLAAYARDVSPSSESEHEELRKSPCIEMKTTNKASESFHEAVEVKKLENTEESSRGSCVDQTNPDNEDTVTDSANKSVHDTASEVPGMTEDSRSMQDMDVDSMNSPRHDINVATDDSSVDKTLVVSRPSFADIVKKHSDDENFDKEPALPERNEKPGTPRSMEVDEISQDVPREDSVEQKPEPMEVDEAVAKEVLPAASTAAAVVPESSSSITESEPLVTSSVENDKFDNEESRNKDSIPEPSQSFNFTCMDIPLDVIPLPEESEPYISGQKAMPDEGIGRIPIPSERKRTSSDSSARSLSPEKAQKHSDSEKSDSSASRSKRKRSRSTSSSSGDRKSAPRESSGGESPRPAEKDHLSVRAKDRGDSYKEEPRPSPERHDTSSSEKKSVAHKQSSSIHETMIPSVLRHFRATKSRTSSGSKTESPTRSSQQFAESSRAEKTSSDSDQRSDSKPGSESAPADKPVRSARDRSKKSGLPLSRSSSQSSAEDQSKRKLRAKAHSSSERKVSPLRWKSRSPNKRDAHTRRTSGSPSSERKSRSPVARRSRSPVRVRRRPSPERRRSSATPSPPRRGYRKSRSPVKNRSPSSRRSKSSSRSPSARRSRSRTRSPARRRYSRSPERRYYRRSWSRPYDSRSRFPRYPRPRNRSPDRSYQRYGRERDRLGHRSRAGVGHSPSRSRSHSRSEVERRRRKRRAERSSSSSSSSRSSSSSASKKQPKKKTAKRRSSSSSSSSSSRSASSS